MKTLLEIHPLAEQFPPMSDLEYAALKADIAENGLAEPITLFEGRILDGRNRYRACRELDIDWKTTEFEGTHEQAAKLSASANLTRRHLSKSQKAMIIAKNGLAKAPSTDEAGVTIRDAASRYGVNHMTIYKAFYVFARDLELAEKVLEGKISVGKAESTLRFGDRRNTQVPSVSIGEENVESVLSRVVMLMTEDVNELARRKAFGYMKLALEVLESSTGDQASKRPRRRS